MPRQHCHLRKRQPVTNRMGALKPKGRARNARYAGIPHIVMESENYSKLSGWDVKLLLELAKQYNGGNNGDLSAAWSTMRKQGWRSPGTLNTSIKRLLQFGFIVQSRQGGRHKCSLYALTWRPIDECKGKLEIATTTQASNEWKVSA